MNFRFVGHLDSFAVVHQLFKQQPQSWPSGVLALRDERDSDTYTKWGSLRRLIRQARETIMADPVCKGAVDGEAPLGLVRLVALGDGNTLPWTRETGEQHRFLVPLVTNPGCFVHIRHECFHAPVGSLWYANAHVEHCEVNWGTTLRVHLLFDLEKAET